MLFDYIVEILDPPQPAVLQESHLQYNPLADGKTSDKARIIERWAGGEPKVTEESHSISEPRVYVYGDAAVVVRLSLTSKKGKSLMRRFIMTLTLMAAAHAFTPGQVRRHNSVGAEIVALEKRAFEAWKNKDKRFFEENMSEDGQYIDQNGVGGKAQYVRAIIDNDCTINGYELDKTKVTMLGRDAALLTYKYTYNIICGGKPEAGLLWSSTVYVRRGGKWLIAFHQEIPAAPAK